LYRYYAGPDHPGKLRLWRWLRNAIGPSRLTVPYCGRGWIALDETDLVQWEVLNNHYYEPEVWEALFSFASGSEVLWDVGAHVGTFSLRSMLDVRVAEVHAFEPDPLTREALELNVSLNKGLGSQCHIHGVAIGSEPGDSVLQHGPPGNTGLSSISSQVSTQLFNVRRTSIDELIFHQGYTPPTLVKIDIEGAEADLLRGAKQFLEEHGPKAIVIEAEARADGVIIDESITRSLEGAGYKINWIKRPGGQIWPRENYLAVRMPS